MSGGMLVLVEDSTQALASSYVEAGDLVPLEYRVKAATCEFRRKYHTWHLSEPF
jgi:hypothetical protein